MSNEQRKDEEAEVEAHRRSTGASDEPAAEGDDEDEVEAHIRRANIRMD
jgi:hypothetical protein